MNDKHTEESHVPKKRPAISAVVISYNRKDTIATCLLPLSFADQVIVVDKSSSDGTDVIARNYADRVIRVPWSPTVEDTRALAVAHCQHDWILLLDDDECLNPEAVLFIDRELREPRADVYSFPLRHYTLGLHDERAYYWPERHIRLFRRFSVSLGTKVHAGITPYRDNVYDVPFDSGACIHHLSHTSAAQWIEKTNRYTSRKNRERVIGEGRDLVAFALHSIQHWASRTKGAEPGSYPEAVAVLRAVYDIVDRIKIWEEDEGIDGVSLFAARCEKLQEETRRRLAHVLRPRGASGATSRPPMVRL